MRAQHVQKQVLEFRQPPSASEDFCRDRPLLAELFNHKQGWESSPDFPTLRMEAR